MNNLDDVTSEYLPNAATAIENDLMLHWYPKRIVERFGHCESLLELGLGHGFTASIFNAACDKQVIVEGSRVVIDLFRKNHPDFLAGLVFDYLEAFFVQYDYGRRGRRCFCFLKNCFSTFTQ